MPPLKNRRRIYPWLIMAVAVLTIVLVQKRSMNRYRPDRVMEFRPDAQFVRVKEGIVYTSAIRSGHTEIKFITRPGSNRKIPVEGSIHEAPAGGEPLLAAPVSGGKSHIVGADSVEAANPLTLWNASIGQVQAKSNAPPAQGGGGGGYSVGQMSERPKPLPPFHIETSHDKGEKVELELRRISSYGALQKLRSLDAGRMARRNFSEGNRSAVIFGDWVYWIRYAPEETSYRISANRQYELLSDIPHCAVMAVPLVGGTPRKLLDGLWEDTVLMASTNGVLCIATKPQTDKAESADRIHRVMLLDRNSPPRNVVDTFNADLPVVLDGSLYWIENSYQGIPIFNKEQRLMQVKEDGAGKSQIPIPASVVPKGSKIEALAVHSGKLYIQMYEELTLPGGAFSRRHTLYSIQTIGKPIFVKVFELPDGAYSCTYDGEFVYCVAMEKRENLIDFSDNGLVVHDVRVLYRFPLPK